MAFADYFAKNLQAASLLLQGIDADAFKSVLAREVIGIAFDTNAVGTAEGQETIDLSIRLIARLYPKLTFIALDESSRKSIRRFEALAKEINPKIELRKYRKGLTRCLVIGKTKPRFASRDRIFVIFVGSNNWLARISTRPPTGSSTTRNPFGAGVAACIGLANIFRAIFAKNLPASKADIHSTFSALEMRLSTKRPKNPPWKEVDLGDLHLAGAGAIANGFLWALRKSQCLGRLHIVDGESLETSNLQRYVMTIAGDEGKRKVIIAKAWLSESKLSLEAHPQHWEQYVSVRNDWRFERVAVAVDNAKTRINIQAALPRSVFNSWTQLGEVGLSRHGFLGDQACLACLYMPGKETANLDEVILRALRLPQTELMEIRRRLDLGVTTDQAFLKHVATAASIPLDQLLPFAGKLLHELYVQGICGGAIVSLTEQDKTNRAEVPMAFQSALTGILLAADVYAEVAELRPRLPTMTQINMLTALPKIPSHGQRKAAQTRCFCVDQDFVKAFQAKYGGATAGIA